MKEFDVICERLVATAIEATVIVVESQLHDDPIPSLRSHYARILEERERLYARYGCSDRALVDAKLRDCALQALEREFRSDTRRGRLELRATLTALLFCDTERRPAEEDISALPDFEHMQPC